METKQFRKRSAILACLRASKEHPSAETLFESLQTEHPDISLATVYRNLALFRSQGLIQSLGTVEGVERFDGDIRPHVHFVCSKCGAVLDLPGAEKPHPVFTEAAEAMGCRIDGYKLMFTGACSQCSSRCE